MSKSSVGQDTGGSSSAWAVFSKSPKTATITRKAEITGDKNFFI
ncbi:hypothetical protein [Amazonocrinis nigriterrae]|nr:hypothetical protein [Amazonocrinis nigriterrae]